MRNKLWHNSLSQILINKSFEERRATLHENFETIQGKLKFAVAKDLDKVEDIQEFLEKSIEGNCEGDALIV